MYERLIVGIADTATSSVAHETACQLAAALSSEVVAVHVSQPDASGPAREILERAATRAESYALSHRLVERSGEPATELMAAADELAADLLVTGDHGIGNARRLTLGGIPDRVAHFSPIDLLIVRTSLAKRPAMPYRRLLVGIDGSITSHQAALRGRQLASALNATTTLAFVGDGLIGDIVLRDAANRLGDGNIDRRLARGNPSGQISRIAAEEGHDLIVVGNKGMAGSARYLRQVVPNRLAHEAPVDVLIIKTVGRSVSDLRQGEGAVVTINGEKVAVYVDDAGAVHALSARCQHLGCTVGWNGRNRTWDCPCHGSRYDINGSILNGPTTKPLPPVEVPD